MNVGLLIIATNKYIKFVQPLITSADKFFLPNDEVTYFLFTDSTEDIQTSRRIEHINIQHQPWPYPTLYRYKHFVENYNKFNNMDYLFYTDSDMLFVDYVDKEIIGDLVGTIHPGFMGGRGTPETNPKSLACVYPHEHMKYCAGGFNGGSKESFLKMSKTISDNINTDLKNNIIAVWHDESHMNRYFINHPPEKFLSPSYCYPESWNIPLKKKLLALDKNHKEIRS